MIFTAYHDIPTLLNLPKQTPKKVYNKLENNHHNMTLSDRLAYVESLVDMNAMVIEAIWPVGSNHNNIVPLRSFIQEVLKRSRTTYSTLQTAFFYLFRARPAIMKHLLLYQQKQQQNHQQQQQQPLKGKDAYIHCGRRMFLASLIVASKFVQDKTYRNSAWAKIAGLPVQEINTSERVFLELLDYRLYVAQNTFNQWHQLLHAHVQAKTTSPSILLSSSNNNNNNTIASLIHPNNNNNNNHPNNNNTIHHILNHSTDSSSSLPSLSPSSLPSSNSSLSSTTSSPVYSPLPISLINSTVLSKKRSRSDNDNDIYQRKRPTFHV